MTIEYKPTVLVAVGILCFAANSMAQISCPHCCGSDVERTFGLITLQPDGTIARLDPDGTVERSFVVEDGLDVRVLALQPDEKILIGGRSPASGGHLGRLNPDGSPDNEFTTALGTVGGDSVDGIVVQTDGKILVLETSWWLTSGVFRLNQDGTRDSGFARVGSAPVTLPDGKRVATYITSMTLQADGKILVVGTFSRLNDQAWERVARLNVDGTLDSSFNPNQSDLALQTLNFSNGTITWLRGGANRQVLRTTFETSIDCVNWTYLGTGQRIVGGWELTNAAVSIGATIRARGFNDTWHYAPEDAVESKIQAGAPIILASDGIFGATSNGFGFSISAAPGQTVTVEASTNNLDWVSVWTNVASSGPIYFSDPEWRVHPIRFYRSAAR
jgi:uncharacterized delta-60 repeat protein